MHRPLLALTASLAYVAALLLIGCATLPELELQSASPTTDRFEQVRHGWEADIARSARTGCRMSGIGIDCKF